MIPTSLLPYRPILLIAAIRFVRVIVPWPLVPMVVVLMMAIVSGRIGVTWAGKMVRRLSNRWEQVHDLQRSASSALHYQRSFRWSGACCAMRYCCPSCSLTLQSMRLINSYIPTTIYKVLTKFWASALLPTALCLKLQGLHSLPLELVMMDCHSSRRTALSFQRPVNSSTPLIAAAMMWVLFPSTQAVETSHQCPARRFP